MNRYDWDEEEQERQEGYDYCDEDEETLGGEL